MLKYIKKELNGYRSTEMTKMTKIATYVQEIVGKYHLINICSWSNNFSLLKCDGLEIILLFL